MSRYVRGVPRDIALCLKDKYQLDTFIETGTLIGYSARWAAKHFKRVFTIEVFDDYYKLAVNNLVRYGNVKCIENRSVFGLEEIRQDFDGLCYPLFWLDAHWSEEAHYGKPDRVTEVVDEIAFINLWKSYHAIIVDDVHKFSTDGWPELEYVTYILENYGKRDVQRVYDVLIATPR